MLTIGLIRHGITDWNSLGRSQGRSDIPLNKVGKQQAVALAQRLSKEKWDVIASSDLSRAKDTASMVAAKFHSPLCFTDERLREIDCGEIEGTTEEDRINKWGSNWRKMNLGMEKFEDVSKRGHEFLEEMAIKYKDKKVLAVSHGALIGLTLQYLIPEKFKTTHIDNTSLTILTKIDHEWDCTLYNCTEHLV